MRKKFNIQKKKDLNKISIGTAQFGTFYGIANKIGKLSFSEGKKIVNFSRNININTFDTACDYINAEKILGLIGVNNCNIVSKLPKKVPKNNIAKWVTKSVKKSLKKLKVKKLHAILIHDTKYLSGNQGQELYRGLLNIKKIGLVKKIGISIYNMSELDLILSNFKIDIVQSPFNIFDQRLKSSGWLKKLKKLNIEIHTRSTFLQGLLLMKKNELPKKFKKWNKIFNSWYKLIIKLKKTPQEICLNFVLSHKEIDKVILGFDSLEQFKEITNHVKVHKNPMKKVKVSDKSLLLNPSKWSQI